MLDILLNIISPHICCSCGSVGAILCGNCFFDIEDEPFEQCIVCLRPTVGDNICPGCSRSIRCDGGWCTGERSGSLRRLIDAYKFERSVAAGKVLARLMAARLPNIPGHVTVAYIPAHPQHRRIRGYDHMRLVAEEVAKLQSWECRGLLERKRDVIQTGTGRSARLSQQKGNFVCTAVPTGAVLLLDDIYTTGSTMTAAVRALKAVSKHPVYIGVIARQPKRK